MGGGYFGNAAVYLIDVVFGFYILCVLMRFLLQAVRADFYNPVSQFLVKMTNPVLVPLRRVIPGFIGIDWASVFLLLALEILQFILIGAVKGFAYQPVGMVVLSVVQLLSLTLNIYFFAILLQVILSWVNPGHYNPVSSMLYSLTEPVLAPARRILPPISGIDFSPMIAMVVLKLIEMTALAYLSDLAKHLL